MPNYSYLNTKTKKVTIVTMTMAEQDQYEIDNPQMQWMPGGVTPTLDSVRLGIRKPEEGFRDLLRHIKKKNPRSTVRIP